jgi:hypothetical protein
MRRWPGFRSEHKNPFPTLTSELSDKVGRGECVSSVQTGQVDKGCVDV